MTVDHRMAKMSRMRVMIVEDDRPTRERFTAALNADKRITFVEQVGSGREAIARLEALKPDVLLVDLGLPDVHGSEIIRRATQVLPQCDCMVITMFGDEQNVLAAIEAGATGYVLKDCEPPALVAHVVDLHAGGAPMSPGVARMVLSRMRRSTMATNDLARSDLTTREIDVLNLLSRGYTYVEVGQRLHISIHTVGSHVKNSYRKLAVHSAAAAVTRAAELKLIRPR